MSTNSRLEELREQLKAVCEELSRIVVPCQRQVDLANLGDQIAEELERMERTS